MECNWVLRLYQVIVNSSGVVQTRQVGVGFLTNVCICVDTVTQFVHLPENDTF